MLTCFLSESNPRARLSVVVLFVIGLANCDQNSSKMMGGPQPIIVLSEYCIYKQKIYVYISTDRRNWCYFLCEDNILMHMGPYRAESLRVQLRKSLGYVT